MIQEKRRFTCLTNGLVRMEFSPTGEFESRRSMVAYAEQQPIEFTSVSEDGEWLVLSTPILEVRSRHGHKAFGKTNLEIRWLRDNIRHYWRPGDRDLQNLGGTIHSLDRFSDYAPLTGVHPADMQSPDVIANEWTDGEFAWGANACYAATDNMATKESMEGDFHSLVLNHQEKFAMRCLNMALDQHRYPPALLSRSGYFFLNDSDSAVLDEDDFPIERDTPGYQDWYFFAYGWNYRQALADFMTLSGKAPLPPWPTLGTFWCRWPAYSETEARELVDRLKQEGIPLTSLVIDMEWHKPVWHNWDWNKELYPDPKAFFDWCKSEHIQTSLNVHPQHVRGDDTHFDALVQAAGLEDKVYKVTDPDGTFDQIEIDLADKRTAAAFMKPLHDESLQYGADFWWVDGAKAHINGSTNEQLITSKLYYEHANTPAKRGMLLSRYGGLGTHRYGAYFTGDTRSQWGVLRMQCEFNIRAGHAGIAYVSHDTGGFSHPDSPLIDPILYIRWLQFGVFNPILRFHSAPGSGSRHPWDYGKANLAVAKRWIQVRNSLLPYIYTAASQHHRSGAPIVRGMFLDDPSNKQTYRFDQFCFGDSILVAPLLNHHEDRDIYLPEGSWYRFETNQIHNSPDGGMTFRHFMNMKRFSNSELMDYPVFVKAGSALPRFVAGQDPTTNRGDLFLEIYAPTQTGTYTSEHYEDDGNTDAYTKGDYRLTTWSLEWDGTTLALDSKTEGSYQPQTQLRHIRLYAATPPSSLKLNGKPLAMKGATKDGEALVITLSHTP